MNILTKEQIKNMPASREMDTLVAEKIMGLNVVSKNHPCGYDPECGNYEASSFIPPMGSWFTEEGPVYLPKNGIYPPEPDIAVGDAYCYVYIVLFYTINIAAAWEVVKKMREARGATMELIAHDDGSYFCVFQKDVPDGAGSVEWIGSSQAETAPLAICRAALLVLLEK